MFDTVTNRNNPLRLGVVGNITLDYNLDLCHSAGNDGNVEARLVDIKLRARGYASARAIKKLYSGVRVSYLDLGGERSPRNRVEIRDRAVLDVIDYTIKDYFMGIRDFPRRLVLGGAEGTASNSNIQPVTNFRPADLEFLSESLWQAGWWLYNGVEDENFLSTASSLARAHGKQNVYVISPMGNITPDIVRDIMVRKGPIIIDAKNMHAVDPLRWPEQDYGVDSQERKEVVVDFFNWIKLENCSPYKVVVTAGNEGVYAWEPGENIVHAWLESPTILQKGGTSDAFAGSVLCNLAMESTLEQIAFSAVKDAARNTGYSSAVPDEKIFIEIVEPARRVFVPV